VPYIPENRNENMENYSTAVTTDKMHVSLIAFSIT